METPLDVYRNTAAIPCDLAGFVPSMGSMAQDSVASDPVAFLSATGLSTSLAPVLSNVPALLFLPVGMAAMARAAEPLHVLGAPRERAKTTGGFR